MQPATAEIQRIGALALREGAATEPAARLHQQAINTHVGKPSRRRDAGRAATNDHDLGVAVCHPGHIGDITAAGQPVATDFALLVWRHDSKDKNRAGHRRRARHRAGRRQALSGRGLARCAARHRRRQLQRTMTAIGKPDATLALTCDVSDAGRVERAFDGSPSASAGSTRWSTTPESRYSSRSSRSRSRTGRG